MSGEQPLGRVSRWALRLVARKVRELCASAATQRGVSFVLPGGEELQVWPGDEKSRDTDKKLVMVIKDARAVWRLVLGDPSMGLAEAYMEGSLELGPSILAGLTTAIELSRARGAASPQMLNIGLTSFASKFKDAILHGFRANTKSGSASNIAAHYDLSNAFFGLFLDSTMTYSAAAYDATQHDAYLSALRRDEALADDATDETLKEAQVAKLDALLDAAGVQNGEHVLEIGCGWLSLALRCCERFDRCTYVAVTISAAQLEEARERLETAPGGSRITVELCDYRDLTKTFGASAFDRVLSCEMIEAVGHDFLPTYFGCIHDALKPGGAAALQIIAVPDNRYQSYTRGSDFIRKHVFPGSNLVCLSVIREALEGFPLFSIDDKATRSLGVSYARTLAAWRLRFESNLDAVRSLGFDEAFIRKWRFYLEYCEAGFAMKHIDDLQIRIVKTDQDKASEHTPVHGGAPTTIKDKVIRVLRAAATALLNRGKLPDFILRKGVRTLVAQQLRHCEAAARLANGGEGGVAGNQAHIVKMVESLKAAPTAVCTREANDQHYEVPTEFFEIVLGSRIKYSACLYKTVDWPKTGADAAALLDRAEVDSLGQVAERAGITDATRSVLDLGCGWGSASLFIAEHFPKAKVVGVSNSHSQRDHIMAQARKRGLANLEIATLDLSKSDLTPALDALASLDPTLLNFEKAVSIEMFEHMKNYDALFRKVADVLAPKATLFVHILCHDHFAYHFVAKSDADWMAKYFFAGGTMPSADLFFYFAGRPDSPFAVLNHWRNNGKHYAATAEAWLYNQDTNAAACRAQLAKTYPADQVDVWFQRWRAFWIALAELFGYNDGNEWYVAHYLFQKM